MSKPPELSRKVIMAWRNFLQTPEAESGLQHLRRYYTPRSDGDTDGAMLKGALQWSGYMGALDDVEDILTALPQRASTIDEPGLSNPREDE